MAKYVNDLGTRLFHSVANRAGDLGEKFEEEFSNLAQNITADVDAIVNEAITLSPYIKVALVCISIILTILSIRFAAYGIRAIVNKKRRERWLHCMYDEPAPPVIVLVPTADGTYRDSRILSDVDGKRLLKQIPGNGLSGEALLGEIKKKQTDRVSNL